MFPFWDARSFSDKKFFFGVQKIGWTFLGFWPGSDNISACQLVYAVFNAFEVLTSAIFQLNFCFVNRQNLVILLDALTPLTTNITSAIKLLFIVWNRKEIKEILDHLKKSFYSDRKPEFIKIHGRISRISFIFTLILCVFTNLTQLFYWLLPAIAESYRLIQGVERNYDLPLKTM